MRASAALVIPCALALASGCERARIGPARQPAGTHDEEGSVAGPPRGFANTIAMRFVLVPAGEFMMGSPETEARRNFDEGPAHRVRIKKPFYMGVTEVTQAQWTAVTGKNPSQFKGDDLPVEHVSWEDAEEFIKKLSEKEGRTYRFPTEAEWEYAARAGTTTPFYTGGTISAEQANYDGEYAYGSGRKGPFRRKTTPVAGFAPNPWGLYDVAGNVHEWCSDWYNAWYYEKSPSDDPAGGERTSSVTPKILRGGSFEDPPWVCRSAARHRDYPGYADDFYGLRLALEP